MDLRAEGRDASGHGGLNKGRLAFGLVACALALEPGFLSLLRLERLADHIVDYIAHYLLISVAYLVACWLVAFAVPRVGRGFEIRWVWAAAILFRATVVPLASSLSDDLVRYRWQGMLQSMGGDPIRTLRTGRPGTGYVTKLRRELRPRTTPPRTVRCWTRLFSGSSY